MFAVLADINWIAIAVAFVISAVLAGVYFPVIIAKPYIVALGRRDAPKPAGSALANFGPVVCVLVTTITTAVLLRALDVASIRDAIIFGLIVGVGYLAAMTFQIAINPNFPRPVLYGLINAPYFVLSSLISSIVLVAMR